MNKHTPGPWDFDSFALREEIRAENNPLIATVCSVHCDSPEQMKANARLIAAAPELLEALRWYAELAEDLNRYPWTVESTLAELRNDGGKRAKEVIAKAKGE